jgi:hypothetical protein
MDIQPQKEICEDFQLQKGKHVHESLVPRFWFGWLRLCPEPIRRRSDHLFRQTETGKVSVLGMSEPGRYPSGYTFQAIPDGSDRVEKSASGL